MAQDTSILSQIFFEIVVLCAALTLPGGGLSEPQYRCMGGLNAPMILIVIAGQAQKSMPVGELNLLGLPGETMRRMVPFNWLRTTLIAAWKTAPRQGVGSQCYL
jgi:hypothetical protein